MSSEFISYNEDGIQSTCEVISPKKECDVNEIMFFLHGNSSSTEGFVYQKEWAQDQAQIHNVKSIFVDFPGHGKSEYPATDEAARKVYSFNGYAELVVNIMKMLNIKSAIIVGWSLGGQVAYSMMKLFPTFVKAAIVFGSPAVTDTDLMCGFKMFPEAVMMGQLIKFIREEAIIFCKAGGLIPKDKNDNFTTVEEQFISDAIYCDGRSRSYMIASSTNGGSVNARELVATCNIPLFTIIALRDDGVNNDYIINLPYKNNTIFKIDSRHATQYECPEEFNNVLSNILVKLTN